jgi:DNA-binding IclR family transcriptional regulator
VRGYRERTGHGPSWGELRRQAGWPREVTDNLMPRLRAAGWLAYDDEPGSLRPGPAAAPWAAEVGSPVTAGPVGVDIAT